MMSSKIPPTILFKQEQPQGKKQVTYRIPALIYITDNQTFLAFAEKHKSSNNVDAELFVMKKGLWKDEKKSPEWVSGHQVLTSAGLPNYRSMNPCPVYERESKTLFLFFICVPVGVSEHQQMRENKNQTRVCYITSKDAGETWSEITDLTADVIGEEEKNWATFAVGPGHGFQMKDKRLIIPAYAYRYTGKTDSTCCCCLSRCCLSFCCFTPFALAFYSDDQGSTWKAGEQMNFESSECQMAEIVEECKIYCNARSTSGYRREALSENKGITFNKLLTKKKLIDTGSGCQGSILSFASDQTSSKTWLLYCHPTDKHQRINLGVYLNKSPSDISGWGDHKLMLHEGPSAYSDLTQCGDGKHFACLMECGENNEVERIDFVLFNLEDLGEK